MENRKIYTTQIPPISREYAEDLSQRFRPVEIKPGVAQDAIMFSAGQRSVIQYVMDTAVKREVSGDPSKLREAKEEKMTFFRRLFRGQVDIGSR